MSRQKFKARGKVTGKMSRDGLVERNAATGEEKRVSKRETRLDLRGDTPERESYSQLGNRSGGTAKTRKQTAYRQSEPALEAEHTAQQAEISKSDSPFTDRRETAAAAHDETDRIADAPDAVQPQTDSSFNAPRTPAKKSPRGKLKYMPSRNKEAQTPTPETAPIEKSTAAHEDAPAFSESRAAEAETAQEAVSPHDNWLNMDKPGKLQFTREEIAPEKPKGKPPAVNRRLTAAERQAEHAAQAETAQETASAHDNRLNMDKSGKLQFTRDEVVPEKPKGKPSAANRRLAKAERQAENAGEKLEKARDNLPTKRKIRSERVFDEQSGKAKRKLYFEKEIKTQGQHLKGALPLRPVKAGANAALGYGHRKIYQVERENVGTQAAHKAETLAEGGVRSALRFHKTAPYRKVAKLERNVAKKSVKLSYQKALIENPKLKSNLMSRFMQKQKIKRQYAKAARDTRKMAKQAQKAGSIMGKAAKAVAGFVRRHPAAAAVTVIGALLLFTMTSLFGLASSVGSSGLGGVLTASYLAENADINSAELAYTEWETDLRFQIENAESDHPGFDEYRYDIDEIGHDPHELMAYLTVIYQNFPYAAISDELRSLFDEQYTLTFVETVETRYYEDEDGDEIPYDWYVLTVTLTVRPLGEIFGERMDEDQFSHYDALMETKGGRQYAGSPFAFNWLPYITSHYGWRVDPFTGAKSYHTGVDIGVPVGTPIIAAHDGVVTAVVWGTSGYGRYITVAGDNGITTRYAHCDALLAIVGQNVEQGEVIAASGNSGNSTGPHLHYEVIFNGEFLNPVFFTNSGE